MVRSTASDSSEAAGSEERSGQNPVKDGRRFRHRQSLYRHRRDREKADPTPVGGVKGPTPSIADLVAAGVRERTVYGLDETDSDDDEDWSDPDPEPDMVSGYEVIDMSDEYYDELPDDSANSLDAVDPGSDNGTSSTSPGDTSHDSARPDPPAGTEAPD